MACELHDETVQSLIALDQRYRWRKGAGTSAEVRCQADELRMMMTEVVRSATLRAICGDLPG
jgi:hypothetical protein